MIYNIGDSARLTVRFALDGVGTDPTAVTLSIQAPDNTTTTPAATSDGSGAYHYDLSITQSGIYRFKWTGTGAVEAVEEGFVIVARTGLVLQPPTSITPHQIISDALRMAGLMGAPERGASPEELHEGIRAYNSMVDAWRLDGLLVPVVVRSTFTLVPNQQSYSIGPTSTDWTPNAADFTAARPVRLMGAAILDTDQSPEPEFQIAVYTLQEWQWIRDKEETSEFPEGVYYEPTTSQDRGTLYVYRVPTVAHTLVLYLEQALAKARLTDALVLAPGYQEALETNLARKLSQRNPLRAKISSDTVRSAEHSLANLRSANSRPLQRESDYPHNHYRSNIYTGDV